MSDQNMSATETMLHERLGSLEQAIRESIRDAGERQSEIMMRLGEQASSQRALIETTAQHQVEDSRRFQEVHQELITHADQMSKINSKLAVLAALKTWLWGAAGAVFAAGTAIVIEMLRHR